MTTTNAIQATNGAAGQPRLRRRPSAPPVPVAAAEAEPAPSPKNAKFRKLGAERTERAIKAIKVIGNLSNRGNYAYSEAEVAKMLKAVRTAVDEVEAEFKPTKAQQRKTFEW